MDLPNPWDLTPVKSQIPKYPFDPEIETPAAKQRRWEHRVVGHLLKHYALLDEASAMMSMARESTGLARLTFEAFILFHPTFPLWLTARKVPYVYKTPMGSLFATFLKTYLYRAFCDAEAEAPSSRFPQNGLVFEWLHSPWPMAILHTLDLQIIDPKPAVVYKFFVRRKTLTLQSLGSFLGALPWSPDPEGSSLANPGTTEAD